MDFPTAVAILGGSQKIPTEYSCLIDRWRDVYYGMSLHTTGACPAFIPLDGKGGFDKGYIHPPNYFGERYQHLFDRILFSRHPRENELTRQWRFSQYKPLTKAPFRQITEIVIGAIFQDSNYDIKIENDRDRQYIWSNSFEGYDLIGWYANIGIPNIMEDPNGLIIRMPSKPYYEINGGEVEIIVHFINSKDIIFYDGRTLIFEKDNYAFYADELVFFRFTRIHKGKWQLQGNDARGYYAHMFGRLPVDVAGGIWNTQGFYDSYLDKAKAAADDYISSYSAEQMVDKEASHPFIIMANEDCGACNGSGNIQEPCDDCGPDQPFELVKCEKCNGRGTISVSPGDRMTASKEDMENDLIKIVNPEVDINRYHHDKNKDIFEKILHALNLYKTDKAESGEAKAIDQERLYQFISKISNHLFDKHIYNSISNIIAYRNLGVINGRLQPINTPFTVTKPTQFQMKTAADLLSEFKTGTESNMPAFVRAKMVSDFNSKQYAGDDIMRRKSDVILEIDDLSVMTADEKLTLATLGDVKKEDLLFSRKLPGILDTIVREKGEQWFKTTSFENIKLEVDRLFEPLIPKTVFIPDDILPPDNTGSFGNSGAVL